MIQRLNDAGFEAYLVGGGIRDLLLDRHPKDFDIATNALPNQIKKLFDNCRLIGRRFRLAHIFFGREIIEVATFRAGHEGAQAHEARTRNDGMVVRDNVYGTIEQDALRRDFTINALYYNLKDAALLDFTNGFKDLQNKKLHIIGDPKTRYQEDPVRMLRAARIAGKLCLSISRDTAEQITKMNHLLSNISPARLYDETIKLFHCGFANHTLPLLEKYELLKYLLPLTDNCLKKRHRFAKKLITHLLQNTDERIHQKKPITPAFLFAVALWYPLVETWTELRKEKDLTNLQAFEIAAKEILRKQNKYTTIPKYIIAITNQIWELQHHLEQRHPKQIFRIAGYKRFRAAYDLLLLRAEAGEKLKPAADWWTEFQTKTEKQQQKMIADIDTKKNSAKKS